MTADRPGYVAGLRALADILEQHDELPLPYDGTGSDLLWIDTGLSDEKQRELARTFARLIPGTIAKDPRDDALDLVGRIEGLNVCLILRRDAVCTRVVTDVREVTREVPDPDALAAVPTVTVTETEEIVEWVCEPILAPREQVPA